MLRKFEKLSVAQIGEDKYLHISLGAHGKVVIAQQADVLIDGKIRTIFLKGSFEFDPEHLENILKAVQEAIEKITK